MTTVHENALLVLVWCYKARSDREQDLWRYRLSEGCIKQWCDKPSGCGCLSSKCEQGEHEAVTMLYRVPWPSCPTYRVKTQDLKHYVSHHWLVSHDTAVRSLIPLLLLRSLSSPLINIHSCLQDLKLSLIGVYAVLSAYWVLLLQTSYISVSWL